MFRWSAVVTLGLLGCGRVAFDLADLGVNSDAGADGNVLPGDVLTVDGQPACNVATPSVVQFSCDFMTAATASVALPSNITAANRLVVAVNFDSSTANPTVSDTAGNTMQPGVLVRGASASAMLFVANITNPGPDTVTVTLDEGAGFTAVFVHELTGVGGMDDFTSQFGMGTTATTPPLSTSFANALVFGHAVSSEIVDSVGNGFTSIQRCAGDMTAYAVAATPGEYAASYTLDTNTSWQATLTSFSPCF